MQNSPPCVLARGQDAIVEIRKGIIDFHHRFEKAAVNLFDAPALGNRMQMIEPRQMLLETTTRILFRLSRRDQERPIGRFEEEQFACGLI